MNSLLLAGIMLVGYVLAYRLYGRFLARKIFRLDAEAICPSGALRDDVDYVPTNKHVLFGHHFTSIAGLTPIVGPAIGIIYGWVPAVIWVLLGSIFIGAVHDFGALVVSLRHQGRSIGDLAADIVTPRVRVLFLAIIFFLLMIVIAVFGLIIAMLFTMYPAAVIPVWLEIPIALFLGWWIYKKGGGAFWAGVIAVIIMYGTVVLGAYVPVDLGGLFSGFANPAAATIKFWIVMILIFNAWLASTLPVQTLLQPRDFINSHQLIIAMGLLLLGVIVAHPPVVAPAIDASPAGAPMWIFPSVFVIIACGAVSGFHCLVSSGTSAKQCKNESDALYVGYGSMMWEAALATLAIVAVAAGIGMGAGGFEEGQRVFAQHYSSWQAASGLPSKLDAFVQGATNMMAEYGMPIKISMAIMAVFIVSFAGTTVDSATRIQRYVVIELGRAGKMKLLQNRQLATLVAVITAACLAFYDGSGAGAMRLWPLFGCLNQLLAGLALLVITIYLAHKKTAIFYTAIPMVFMILMTGWAMVLTISGFYRAQDWLLFGIGIIVFALELWMIAESYIVLRGLRLKRAD
ncbi:MAG: carbon starvation protein A [Sedimentisphaerales bacterium]|nr:carbon starvation protein A [Sedimentisphaerales bacterium]